MQPGARWVDHGDDVGVGWDGAEHATYLRLRFAAHKLPRGGGLSRERHWRRAARTGRARLRVCDAVELRVPPRVIDGVGVDLDADDAVHRRREGEAEGARAAADVEEGHARREAALRAQQRDERLGAASIHLRRAAARLDEGAGVAAERHGGGAESSTSCLEECGGRDAEAQPEEVLLEPRLAEQRARRRSLRGHLAAPVGSLRRDGEA